MAGRQIRSRNPATKVKQKRPTSERAARAELVRLTRRVGGLVLAYVGAGRATPKLQASTARLKSDIDAWRDGTGRRELRAVKTTRAQPGGGDFSCSDCLWIMFSSGRVCFLVGCDPEWNNCSYICITLPKEPIIDVS
jgi:hypothetical protein